MTSTEVARTCEEWFRLKLRRPSWLLGKDNLVREKHRRAILKIIEASRSLGIPTDKYLEIAFRFYKFPAVNLWILSSERTKKLVKSYIKTSGALEEKSAEKENILEKTLKKDLETLESATKIRKVENEFQFELLLLDEGGNFSDEFKSLFPYLFPMKHPKIVEEVRSTMKGLLNNGRHYMVSYYIRKLSQI